MDREKATATAIRPNIARLARHLRSIGDEFTDTMCARRLAGRRAPRSPA
ncbi:MAG: hypothetical protein GX868_12650 [Actinobacteria bacterium]|nr:hypothetical protein [Actinomycetota bacterium]